MKNFALIIALIGSTSSIYAQQTVSNMSIRTETQAGNWVVGVETDNLLSLKKVAGPGDDHYLRRIMPTVGYFVTNSLVLGIGVPIGLAPRHGTYYTNGAVGQAGVYTSHILPKQVGVAPFVQQFLGRGKLKPYIGASYRYTYQQLDFNISQLSVYLKQTGNESELSIFTGLTYLIIPKLSIDAKFRYGWQNGNHPYMSFPNRLESGFSSTLDFTGQTASANIGLRLMISK